MKVAIATNSVPKSAGVKQAFGEATLFTENVRGSIEYILHGTPSGVSDMPLSEEETLLGAKNRVKALRNAIPDADFYVGVEGGACKTGDDFFLFGASYVESQEGEGHTGISGKVEIPQDVGETMLFTGQELSAIMEARLGKSNIKHENGTIGILSHDLLPRDKAFADATLLALARFF